MKVGTRGSAVNQDTVVSAVCQGIRVSQQQVREQVDIVGFVVNQVTRAFVERVQADLVDTAEQE